MKRTITCAFLFLFLMLCTALVGCGHTHAFGGYRITKAPTCTEDGERTGTCACGEVHVAAVAAKGHGQTEERVTVAPTCTDEGTRILVCTACGQTLATETVDVAEHTGEREVIQSPTCTLIGRAQMRCTVCDATYGLSMIPKLDHSTDLAYTYNGDATAFADGTATAACPYCDYTHTKTLDGTSALIAQGFAGKKVSILGDSISTYPGISNGVAADTTNSTIRYNALWNYGPTYPASGVTDPTHTWWQKTVDALGAERLVNNSWSGDKITDRALKGRATQLHDDTGDNAGELPDIIFIYLGTNDFSAVGASVGSVASLSMSDIATLAAKSNYTPTSVAEAYAVMLYRIKEAYPDAEIYCLTVLEKPNVNVSSLATFNDGLIAAASLFEDVYVADIFRDSGIHDDESFDYYVPGNRLHPGENGMRAISKVLLDVIYRNSKYMPAGFTDLLPTDAE